MFVILGGLGSVHASPHPLGLIIKPCLQILFCDWLNATWIKFETV